MRAMGPAVTVALAVALGCPTASGEETAAAPAPPAGLEAVSQCPSADEVWSILFTLLPAEARDLDNLRSAVPPLFEVHDEGRSYDVRSEGTARTFDDPARDCARRARLAAVFVAVVIEPRVAAALPAPAAAPPPKPVDRRLDLALSGTLWSTPTHSSPGGGAAVRAAYALGAWGLSTTVAWQAPWTETLGATAVREQRLAVSAAARRQWRLSAGVPFVEAGLAAVGTRFNAPDLAAAQPATTVEGALTGLGGFRWGRRRVAPWFAVGVRLVPLPARVTDTPAGDLGRAPRFWLNADVGLSVML